MNSQHTRWGAHAMTYTIVDGKIRCELCGSVSGLLGDIQNKYCGRCHLFHEVVHDARQMHHEGATHDCGEWRTARGRCAVCDRPLRCPCRLGVPIDYDKCDAAQANTVLRLIAERGEYMSVSVGGRTFRVSRHCIAIHGITGADVDRYGFEEK